MMNGEGREMKWKLTILWYRSKAGDTKENHGKFQLKVSVPTLRFSPSKSRLPLQCRVPVTLSLTLPASVISKTR
jgi:hypothetical protein